MNPNYKADTCIPLKNAWWEGKVELEALTRLSYPGRPMPKNMLPGVNTIGYWDSRTQQSWGFDWHRNEGIELTFLENSTLAFAVEGQEDFLLQANDLTITRPWQLHKLGNPNVGIGRLYWIILDVQVKHPHQPWKWPSWIILSPQDLKELTIMLRQNEQPVWKTGNLVYSFFKEIGKAIKEENAENCQSKLTILINELLLNLLQMFKKGNISLDKSLVENMRSAELFIASLPGKLDQDWTLEAMANYCSIGTTRFVHYCKKITNMTPVQYLNYLRLEEATKKLMEHPGKNISLIAYECGFTSSQYFATVFKRQHGATPNEFRINAGVLKAQST